MRILLFKLAILCCCCLLAVSCRKEYDHKGKVPLAQVNGSFFYMEDLHRILPLNLSQEDSALFAEKAIREWAENEIVLQKAEDNIPENINIDELINSYRKTLILHAYQEGLVRENLNKEITDEEIKDYYEQHSMQYLLSQPLVKGIFIKVPNSSNNLKKIKSIYRKSDQNTIEQLEKYSISDAAAYEYFYDVWHPVSEFAAKIPLAVLKTNDGYLSKIPNVSVQDSTYTYLLHVSDFLGKGEVSPLEFVKDEIKDIILNIKRVEYIVNVKQNLYEQAVEKGKIKFFNKDEKN